MTNKTQAALVEHVLSYENMPAELVGSGAIWNPSYNKDSSPRQNMLGANVSQFTMIHGPQRRRFGAGAELLYQPHSRKIKVNSDCRVLQIFHEQQGGLGNRYKGVSFIEVENMDTYETTIVSLELANYTSDLTFCFSLVPTEEYRNLHVNMILKAGTILADSPMLVNGEYTFTREANVAYVQLPWTIEDGIGVMREWVNGFTCTGYGKRKLAPTQNQYLLNTYGTSDDYRAIAEPGEELRLDGLVACYRSCNALFDHALMGIEDVKHPDRIIDTPIYGVAGGRVTKLQIQNGNNALRVKAGQKGLVTLLPSNQDRLLQKYATAKTEGARSIVNYFENKEKRDRSIVRHYSDRLTAFIADAHEVLATKVEDKTNRRSDGTASLRAPIKSLKGTPLPQWDISLWYEYDIVPTLGTKLTGSHGDKAVITYIYAKEDAPRTQDGQLVDYTQAPESLPKRTNMGTIDEPFINAASDTCSKRLKVMLEDGSSIDEMWDVLMSLYSIVSKKQHQAALDTFITDDDRLGLIEEDAHCGVHWISQSDNQISPYTLRDLCEAGFRPFYEPIWIKTHSSVVDGPDFELTYSPVMVGKKSIMMLEKIGSDAGACADIKIQAHGLPAKTNAADKYTTPWIEKALKTSGETEVRHRAANGDAKTQAEMIAIASDPKVSTIVYDTILTADDPSNIERLLPYGTDTTNGRGRALVRNVRACQGVQLVKCQGED